MGEAHEVGQWALPSQLGCLGSRGRGSDKARQDLVFKPSGKNQYGLLPPEDDSGGLLQGGWGPLLAIKSFPFSLPSLRTPSHSSTIACCLALHPFFPLQRNVEFSLLSALPIFPCPLLSSLFSGLKPST